MIEVLTRVQHPALYARMVESARQNAEGKIAFRHEDNDGLPRIAESYNRLGDYSEADTLVFCHDDIQFLSKGWDKKVEEALEVFDVVGVVGTQEYNGRYLFDSGYDNSVGRLACEVDGKMVVKLMKNRTALEPAMAVDGVFMAMRREYFRDTRFDEQFDGLFFYDADFCLRSVCGVVDILILHHKPDNLRGVYPPDMAPIEAYRDAMDRKHGLKGHYVAEPRCEAVLLEDYR